MESGAPLKAVLLLLSIPALLAAAGVKVQIRTAQGTSIVEMPLERYVAAALAGESSVFQSAEALKAMAVASRTYAVNQRGRHAAEGFDFCDTTHCQRLDPAAVSARLEAAVSETAGELLWFEGKPAFTPYTADCGGRSENAAEVWPDLAAPYLRSARDPYCVRESAAWNWTAPAAELANALTRAGLKSPRTIERISILDRTASGRARTLLLSSGRQSVRISASTLRFAVGRELGWNTVRSSLYEVYAAGGRVVFAGSGAGHGVGLCQRGAEVMGRAGRSYREILAQYYPGAFLGVTARGLRWQRLRGELLTLLTTRPDVDRPALAAAERAARAGIQRTGFPFPQDVEIRAYPDLDTFRNATAEPGWVAARTDGRVIHLQPVAVLQNRRALESTLRHEVLHVLLESQAAPGLPVWFREGLPGFLAGEQAAAAPATSSTGIRQRNDAGVARRAYADAVARVAALARRYGEATVLSWLKRGLPPEVTNATATQPTTRKQ